MSRGFVKESDQEPAPYVPPRAPLPPGAPNYVTPSGLAALRAEFAALEDERRNLNESDEDRQRRELVVLNARLTALNRRITSARLIEPTGDAPERVRFGTTVRLTGAPGTQDTFRIVGVDEADAQAGLISFASPLAKTLTGLRVGDTARLLMGPAVRTLTVAEIKK